MEFQFTFSPIPSGRSFIVFSQSYENYSVLHAHQDFELNLMVAGEGKRIVGNKISTFGNDDLILVGPNMPHNRCLDETERINAPECLTLFIAEKLIKSELAPVPELEPILKLFNRSLSGLVFKGKGVKVIHHQLKQLAEIHGVESFVQLFNLLKTLTEIEVQEIISLTPEVTISQYRDLSQIKIIYDYVVRHLQESITLDKAAGLLNMAPGSFSRYFKKRTGKSFIQYVKDIRIAQASKMLSDTEIPIAQICFESGYNNLANFNFYFKSIMKMTPSEYRKSFR